MQNVELGVPFLVAGAVKSVYDLSLWRMLRRTRGPQPTETGARRSRRGATPFLAAIP